MSIAFIRKNQLLHRSERLGREVFIDELGELTDTELQQLIVEATVTIAELREDHSDIPDGDVARYHVRHKMGIVKAYRQAALIEQGVREAERNDKVAKLRDALIDKLGAAEAVALLRGASLL